MPPKAQLYRDIVSAFIVVLFSGLFFSALAQYLEGLQKPFLLLFAFGVSLVATYVYEIKSEPSRHGVVGIAATAILFTAGIQLAQYFRLYYVDLLTNIDQIQGAKELLGQEYLSLVHSKVVGYGGAYGLGLITTRVLGQHALKKVLTALLITTEFQKTKCHHCQQDITR